MASVSYTALSALGAPLTLEEYTRLFNGPLADILTFLSEHLVGRQAAASARTTLFLAQEAQAKSQLKQPATTRSRADKALARLAAARTSSVVYTTQSAELQEKTQTASARLAALQRQLDAKHRLLLLLKVLEAKHALRTQRIEALTRKIDELKHTPLQVLPVLTVSPSICAPPTVPRTSHTRDRLADLHRLMLRTPAPNFNTNPTQQLQRTVARILSTDPNHPYTKDVVERCLAFAQSHAGSTHDNANGQRPDTRSLDTKSQSNKEKALKLQSLVERCEALRLACEDNLAEISDHTISLPSLSLSLKRTSQAAKGHVDLLRVLVLATAPEPINPEDKSESFASRVKHACGMSESVTTKAVLEEVGRVVRKAHRRQRLLHAGTSALLAPPSPSVDLAIHLNTTETAHIRAVELLTRKAAKAGAGQARAVEVEGVISEWGKLVGVVKS
ncbi:hypothetical protein DFH08DRAFT_891447 [Mycena albidolilacea]|uniref:Uncharacterized protein n=1 Tax=Mycena albidolilacea TaxID=1033008 RepID=A0AAD7EGD5_9AGAR|nr:hypothetical protein DFH08DRAFT_891447 [Mycena albidolilacea]